MLKTLLFRANLKLLKRNQFTSLKLRSIFKEHYGIDVGLYSYGCFDFKRIGRGTVVGRYCSIAPTAYVFTRNHPSDFVSTHPYLYNDAFDFPIKQTIKYSTCIIEDDVWIGHNAVILPRVSRIGRGSIIAAGAVIKDDVPAYSIVAGNPGKTIKTRFSKETIQAIEATKWWELSAEELGHFAKNNFSFVFNPERSHVEQTEKCKK